MAEDDLMDVERRGWHALSTSGRAAVDFYERVLDDAVVMLLPGGTVLDDRDQIVRSMSGQPWSSYALEVHAVLRPTPDTGIVAYGVVAERAGMPPYSALVSSAYVRRSGGWRLTFHQQTPR